ncbi:MAG: hypothetical protein DRP54_04845 [Spirochaetes bacterium]|nr:MAG: hypothetical protein DRP54_04845 [Spirochaetota bacterium]
MRMYGLDRFNLNFRKYLLFWAFSSMVIGYLAGKFNHERVVGLEFIITPLLFLMVFIMVLPTRLASLLQLSSYLYPMIVSFILFLISPFLSYIVSLIIPENFNYLRTGIVVASTVPPDAMLSAWAGFFEADILLTLIIQSFTFLMWIFLVPFGLSLFFGGTPYYSVWVLVNNLLILIVIPFLAGGLIKFFLKRWVKEKHLNNFKPTLSTISGLIELFILLISVALSASIISENPVIILWGVLTSALYYFMSFVISISLALLFSLPFEYAIPVVYQNGSKNLGLGLVVALTSFKNQAVLGVAACVLAQLPISSVFYTFISRFEQRRRIVK